MPAFPLQQGSPQAVQTNAPTFASVEVIDDTWDEDDNTVMKDYANYQSQTKLTALANPGQDISCRWTLHTGVVPYVKGEGIQALTDTVAPPRAFLVVGVKNSKFGGFVVEQTVKLRYKVSQTITTR